MEAEANNKFSTRSDALHFLDSEKNVWEIIFR